MRKRNILTLLIIFLLNFFSLSPAYAQGTGTPIDLSDESVTEDGKSSESDMSGICQYVENDGSLELQIDDSILNTKNILMGISDPKDCPLPGSEVFADYPKVAGEFLFSGVVCVTQSIILDAMFRVYCTILLWMYQIIYAMLVVYIMFYGLVIMFDLSNNPIKEVSMRVMKIMFIFFLAVNAEWGFKWIHQSFTVTLTGFSNILTRLQPLYTEGGEAAYRWDKDTEEWILLDENGNDWRPVEDAPVWEYFDIPPPPEWIDSGYAYDHGVPPAGLSPVPAEEYVPYRLPAMQFMIDRNDSNKVVPVFQDVHYALPPAQVEGLKVCLLDFKYNASRARLEIYPRCNNKDWPAVPNIAPYAQYCLYISDSYTGSNAADPVCLNPTDTFMYPPKLKDVPGNVSDVCDEENEPETCRQPFQGILGKIDAMFNSVVGDDNAKGLGAMVVALILWGMGGGVLLALLLMSGITAMFVAFIQILWTYATSLMGLTFLMMLAPIFLSFALFKSTERLFRSWLGSLISFAWQPILILGFLYVLASATTLDRLTELAKHEISTVTYDFSVNEGQTKSTMSAPGFLAPLYDLPPEVAGDTELIANIGTVEGKLTKEQREKLRTEMARQEAIKFISEYAGIPFEDLDKDANALKQLHDAGIKANVEKALQWFNTEVDSPHPVFPDKTRKVSGADALKHYYDNEGETWLQPFVDSFRANWGFDDGDAYIGEPPLDSPGPTDNPKGEYPICNKNCPGFIPAYKADDPTTVNPDASQCVSFCMFIYDSKEEMFNYLIGAVIIWIILNVMTGAFMARVPEMAKRLANWQNMASQTPAIGGAGESSQSVSTGSDLVQEGTGGFTMKERTGVYHGGSIWGLGLGPSLDGDVVSRPGAVPAALEKMTRMGRKTERVEWDAQQGRYVYISEDRKSVWERQRLGRNSTTDRQWRGQTEAVKAVNEALGVKQTPGSRVPNLPAAYNEYYEKAIQMAKDGKTPQQIKAAIEAMAAQRRRAETASRSGGIPGRN